MGTVAEPSTDRSGGAPVVSLAAAPARRSGRPSHRVVRPRLVERSAVALQVAAERQRIAGALHDDVSSLLFAAAVAVQRAETVAADDVAELRRTLSLVGEQVREAADRIRDILGDATPAEPADGVPAAAQRDLDDLAVRSGIAAHLVVRGSIRDLPTCAERVALNCLRQALFNIERHAGARTVIVTLSYASAEEFVLVVQDDGGGLPAGFEPRAVPAAGRHWGFVSMARQVEQRGGELELTDVEDGGTRLRVRLPA